MIVKNAEKTLRRAVESCLPLGLDEVVIVNTGSSDGTEGVARALATSYADYQDPDPIEIDGELYVSDFSKARNYAMGLCKSDYIFWIDSDDVLVGATKILDSIEKNIRSGICGHMWMFYDYEYNDQGICVDRHPRIRFAAIPSHVWRAPLHEVLLPHFPVSHASIPYEAGFILHDKKPNEKTRQLRNLRLLERFKERNQELEPRFWLSYGRALLGNEKPAEAIPCIERYLVGSLWNGEKYHAYQVIAECHRKLGHYDRAIEACFRAVRLFPENREAYHELAGLFLHTEEFEKCLYFCDLADQAKGSNEDYTVNPFKQEVGSRVMRAYAYMKSYDFKKAVEEYTLILSRFPGHRDSIVNRAICSQLEREQDLVDSSRKLEFWINLEGDDEKVSAFKKALPRALQNRPEFASIFNPVLRGNHSIAFFCPRPDTTWGFDSVEKGGVGGSETAVIYLTKELAKLGWDVTVYGYPAEYQEGIHDGVLWLPWWRGRSEVRQFDVFVAWRNPATIALLDGKQRYIWCHDVVDPNDWVPEVVSQIDAAIVLSKCQRDKASFLPDEKVWISSNGLDSSWFRELKNDPQRLIYASSPDRGLIHLLDAWPEIRAAYPNAALEVYYGFTSYFREAMAKSESLRKVYEETLRKIDQPGITVPRNGAPGDWLVDQRQLSEAFHRSGIWAYPSTFPEISCITAMQAQTSGAIPVCSGYWALSETVRHGKVIGARDDQFNDRPDLRRQWLDELLRLMGSPREQEMIRMQMVPESRIRFLWSEVARCWNEKFLSQMSKSLKALSVERPVKIA